MMHKDTTPTTLNLVTCLLKIFLAEARMHIYTLLLRIIRGGKFDKDKHCAVDTPIPPIPAFALCI